MNPTDLTERDRAERTPEPAEGLSAEERAVLDRVKTQTRAKRPGWLRRLAKNPPVFYWFWYW